MRRAVLSLLPSSILAVGAVVLGTSDRWGTVGVPLGDRNFGDLNVIFVAAECASTDPAWTARSEPCQPGMAHYNYPSVWAKAFGLIDADPSWTPTVAALLMGVFIVSLIPLTWFALGGRRVLTPVLGMIVTSLTPPVWLAFQRGNIDLLIFALITAAICLWIKRATKSAAAFIAVAATLKIFPVGAALLLTSPQRPRRGALITFVLAGTVGALLVFRDLTTISERTPQIDGASFGTGLLPLLASSQLSLNTSSPLAQVIGLGVFAVVLTLMAVIFHRTKTTSIGDQWQQLARSLAKDPIATGLLLAGSGVFLIAYLLGPSYDYRLIFLIPVIAALFRVGSTMATTCTGVLILQMILSYSTFVGALEYLSDLMFIFIAPAIALCAWQVLRRVNA